MFTFHLTRDADTRYRVTLVTHDGTPLVRSRGFRVRSNALHLVTTLRRLAEAWPAAPPSEGPAGAESRVLPPGVRLRRRADGVALEVGEGAVPDAESAPAASLAALLDRLGGFERAARAPLRDYTRVGPRPTRSTRRISVEFDPGAADPEAVVVLLHALAALYRGLGGDALVVRESGRAPYVLTPTS